MRIAFVTLNAYDMLTGTTTGTVGGAQLQQIHVGRELADRGHDVHFVENDGPGKRAGTVDGITVALKPDRTAGPPLAKAGLRALDTLAILGRVDPDVCYVRMPLFELFPVALYCRLTGTRLVYGFAHDSELTSDPVTFETSYTDNELYRQLMHAAQNTADVLVAQNDFQYARATQRFGAAVEKIPNGYPIPEGDTDERLSDLEGPIVLWVSTLRPWKRPEIVLEAADELPEVNFVVVGGPDEESPETAEGIADGARERENVVFEGFVPHDEIEAYYERADIFLNTSTDEGFPNTFLEAWAHETPVVSLAVDPSNLITDHDVGYVADSDRERLFDHLRSLASDRERRRTLASSSYRYFVDNHSIEHVAKEYERVLTGE